MNFTRQAVPVVAVIALILIIGPVACTRVTVDPIEVKPIHIVHDINIRVDRQLDEFFAFQEQPAATTTTTATTTTQPATNATTQTVAGDAR
jgi:hypothetical protein